MFYIYKPYTERIKTNEVSNLQQLLSVPTIILVFLSLIVLTGCQQSDYNQALEDGQAALGSDEPRKAITAFQLAMKEKPHDKKAEEWLAKAKKEDIAHQTRQIETALSKQHWDEAIQDANALIGEYGKDTRYKELTTKAASSLQIATVEK